MRYNALHIGRNRASRERRRNTAVCIKQERDVILELDVLEERRCVIRDGIGVAVHLDLLRIADRGRARLVAAAEARVGHERLLFCGVKRYDIILFQTRTVNNCAVLDDFILRRDVCRGCKTVDESICADGGRIRQNGEKRERSVLIIISVQRIARQNGRPDLTQGGQTLFAVACLSRAGDIGRRCAVGAERAGFRYDAVSGGACDLVGFLTAGCVRHHADRNVFALLADDERAVDADQAAVERTCGLSSSAERAVFEEQRFIRCQRAVGFARFEQDAVLDGRGGHLADERLTLCPVGVSRRAEGIQQHGCRVAARDGRFRVPQGNAPGQTERVRLRDVVSRPERADVALLVAEHAQQHGADFSVGQRLVRSEGAVCVAADDVVVLELRVTQRGVDIACRPVRGVDVRENRVACVGTRVVDAHGGDGELAELRTGQRTARLKPAVPRSLHDAERVQDGRRLLKRAARNVAEYRSRRSRRQCQRQAQADETFFHILFLPFSYCVRRASTGWRLDALFAGYRPKMMPSSAENRNAPITSPTLGRTVNCSTFGRYIFCWS